MLAATTQSGDVKAAQGMNPGRWCPTFAVLGLLGTLVAAAAPHGDFDTSEELRQALVLIDILRSGKQQVRT